MQRAAPSRGDLGLAALEADDRDAPGAIAPQPEVAAAEPALQPTLSRQGHRHARLRLVGETRHVGQGVLTGERAKGLATGVEVLEEDPLVHLASRRRTDAKGDLADHAEGPLRSNQ